MLERESTLYAALAEWEVDLPRRHAMHKRRIALLKPAIEEVRGLSSYLALTLTPALSSYLALILTLALT